MTTLRKPSRDIPLRHPAAFDAVTFLSIYVFLLCAIPSYLTIPALGSVGRLSVLWGLVGIAWWGFYRLQTTTRLSSASWFVKIPALMFFSAAALTYAWTNLQGLPSNYATTSDSSLIRLASWFGVVLVALDGIPNRERLLVLVRRVVIAGALMSLLGITQFATGQSLVDSISLPGFSTSPAFDGVQIRGDFLRSAGTASHPLEYGSVLCIALPLGLILGFHDRDRRAFTRWFPPTIIAVASMVSMSRSALIGIAVGLILTVRSIPSHLRFRTVGAATALLTAMVFIVPGMLGTVRGLFLGIGNDSSSLSRVDSLKSALEIAWRSPILGQGFGSFSPNELILDNQIVLLLIELGIIGLVFFGLLVLSAMIAGWRVARDSELYFWKSLSPAISAGLAAGATTLLFFDGLSFPITGGLVFLMIGIAGALPRCTETSQFRLQESG